MVLTQPSGTSAYGVAGVCQHAPPTNYVAMCCARRVSNIWHLRVCRSSQQFFSSYLAGGTCTSKSVSTYLTRPLFFYIFLVGLGLSLLHHCRYGETALHITALKQDFTMVQALVDAGADINAVSDGTYPGHKVKVRERRCRSCAAPAVEIQEYA